MGGVNRPNVASFTIWWFYNSEFYCMRTPDPSEVVGPETKMVDTGTLTRADLAEMLNRQIGRKPRAHAQTGADVCHHQETLQAGRNHRRRRRAGSAA